MENILKLASKINLFLVNLQLTQLLVFNLVVFTTHPLLML